MRPTAQLNHRVSRVQPLIKTQGFMRFTLNHLHGFYMAHPKPSSWVLCGSPVTFTMGFIRLTRNLHHGFYMVHPKPTPRVLYGSPETFTMGFTITDLEKPRVSTFVW